ncbi:hypothetical protein L9F63_014920, partial [Diploptera punctata]
VFWTLIVLTAVISAVFIMGMEWNFHLSRYTITSMDTAHYPLWNIPYPAVTVCPTSKIKKTDAIQLLNELELPSGVTKEEIFKDMKFLLELLEPSDTNITKFIRLQTILDNNNISIEYIMKRVTPKCNTFLTKCKWKGHIMDSCSLLFKLHKTYEGYCCSFNYVGIKEDILKIKEKPEAYIPQKTTTSGHSMGLTVLVRIHPEEYYVTNMASYGVKVLIHDPNDYPDINSEEDSVYRITDTLFHSSVECRENYTIELCGCTHFYYPNNGDYRICNLTDVPCLAKNKSLLLPLKPRQEDFTSDKEPINYPCNCLPDCENYYYPIESSEGVLSESTVNNDLFFNSRKLNLEQDSMFSVYFNNFMVTSYRRDVLYSWKGLLGSLGGLLSLFIGFSLIGAVELLYFFTLRLYYKDRIIKHKNSHRIPHQLSRPRIHHHGRITQPTLPISNTNNSIILFQQRYHLSN